jgi:hypothetical protein
MRSASLHRIALVVVTAALNGCNPDPVGPTPEVASPPGDSIADKSRAFFIVNRAQLESAAWPEQYVAYGLFVCDPAMGPEDFQTIRTVFPDAIVLAYANAQNARIAMSDSPYWQAFTAAFDSALCIRNLETGSVVRLHQGLPSFVLRHESIEALVAFHRDVTMSLNVDGIYMDQVTLGYPEWKRVLLLQMAPLFDIDDDGVADDLARLDATYAAWKPHFLQRLREEVGDLAVVLANTNGPLGHPGLNGMTIENVHFRFTVEEAAAWITQQHAVSWLPRYNVLWAIHGSSRAPSEALAACLPNTLVGDLTPRNPDPLGEIWGSGGS